MYVCDRHVRARVAWVCTRSRAHAAHGHAPPTQIRIETHVHVHVYMYMYDVKKRDTHTSPLIRFDSSSIRHTV